MTPQVNYLNSEVFKNARNQETNFFSTLESFHLTRYIDKNLKLSNKNYFPVDTTQICDINGTLRL